MLKKNIILILLLLLASFLIFYRLSSLPHGLFDDEIDAGYIGKYLLLHGKDLSGNILPIAINKFGDYRPIGIFIVAGLGTLVFGNSIFAIRFSPALFGVANCLAMYFFVYELTRKKSISLVAVFLLATMPWHIVLSRATSDGIPGLFFSLVGLTFLIKGIRTAKTKNFVFSGIGFFLSYFMYHPFRLVTPLYVLPFCFVFWKEKNLRIKLLSLFLIFSFLSAMFVLTPAGKGRFTQVAFYNNPTLPSLAQGMIQDEGQNNIMVARIFDNKLVFYTKEFLKQYFSYYSPSFLLQDGWYPVRYQIPLQGLLLYSSFVLLVLGLLLWRGSSSWHKWYMLYLLIIASLPAALTYDDAPNVHRAIIMIIPIIFFAASGAVIFFEKLQKIRFGKVILGLFVTVYLIESIYFLHQYSAHTASNKSILRNDGAVELTQFVISQRPYYGHIVLPGTNDLPLYYLFFTNNYALIPKQDVFPGNHIKLSGKVQFVTDESASCGTKEINKFTDKALFVDTENCPIPLHTTIIKTIYRKDSTLAFRILQKN